MGTPERRRRKMTAREAAKRFGISERHVRNIAAEPREEWERRAHERWDQILIWREEGMLWREIADRLSISRSRAQKRVNRADERLTIIALTAVLGQIVQTALHRPAAAI